MRSGEYADIQPGETQNNPEPAGHLLSDMPKRYPTNGTFELTVRCNLQCKMCLFRHDDSENPYLRAKELTTQEWIDMARQAAEAGTFSLLITGGEPMLRPDFCEIYEAIYKQGFLIQLYTNATLVNDKVMATLEQYPPHRIGVTLYGASPETYEKVCGSKKAFHQAMEGMRRLWSLPSIMEFRTTIIKDNQADIDAMEALIRREFGPDQILTCARMVNKSVRGACSQAETVRLSPEDNVRFIYRKGIRRVQEKVGTSFDYDNLQIRFESEDRTPDGNPKPTFFGCDAGMTQYTITWDGKLLGCQMLGAFSTDARNNGFKDAWDLYPASIRFSPLPEECGRCELASQCNSCYATRYAESGRLDLKPDYACQDTHYLNYLTRRVKRSEGKDEI